MTRCEWSPSTRQLWVLYQILEYLVQHLFLEVLQGVDDENLAKDHTLDYWELGDWALHQPLGQLE